MARALKLEQGKVQILRRIRWAIQTGPQVHQSLPDPLLPSPGDIDRAGLLEEFRVRAVRSGMSVTNLGAMTEVPDAVRLWVQAHDVPLECRLADTPEFAKLPWQAARIRRIIGPARRQDILAVGFARCGVAELGSLLVCGSPSHPASLAFVPQNFIAVLRADDVVQTLEQAFASYLAVGEFPNTAHLISGTSDCADVDQQLASVGQGPLRVNILLVGGAMQRL